MLRTNASTWSAILLTLRSSGAIVWSDIMLDELLIVALVPQFVRDRRSDGVGPANHAGRLPDADMTILDTICFQMIV